MSEYANRSGDGLTRRQFLGATAAMGAAALIGPSLLTEAYAAEAERETLNMCWWGLFRAKAKNGRMVEVLPFEKDPYPNAMTREMVGYVNSPARVKYPMVRKGFLKNGHKSDTSERGRGEFVRVSWDKALDLVAGEIRRVIKTYGNSAIYSTPSGWYNLGQLHSAGACMNRLENLLGGFTRAVGDYSSGASQFIMPYVVGDMEVYSQQTAWPVIEENTEVIVMWGANPLVTLQISWPGPTHGGLEGLAELRKRGRKIIVIDPVRTDTAEQIGSQWIAPRPNTDVAMMLGVAHVLHTEGLANREFLDEYTVGYDKFLAYLLGKEDGVEKSPEWAAGVCGVDADVIRALARTIAGSRTLLMSGWGMQRADHGEQPHWMLVTLACMLGQIGLPGGGFTVGHHYSSQGAPSATAPVIPGLGGGKTPEGHPAPIPTARSVDMLLNPGKVIDFNGRKVTFPDIKMIYNGFSNEHTRHPERRKMMKAWRKPETIVIHEMFWTPTARMADIVLPVCTSLELNDISSSENGQFLLPMKKLVEPLYESRSTYDVFTAVAERLGVGREFTEGKTDMDWLRSFYDGARSQAKTLKVDMPDFNEFWEKGEAVEFPISQESREFVRYADYREDPLMEPLGTPSGKIEIYSKDIEKMGYDDCLAHAAWIEPAEWLGSPKAKTYPMHLLTGHPKYRLHSQMNHVAALRKKYTIGDREPIWINADDAKARGIANGDIVRVFNDRGQVLAGAFVTDRIRSGVVRLCEGGWYDPVEPGREGSLCKYGSANVLTLDKGASKLSQAVVGNTALVQIEKYTGKVPAVTAFDGVKEA
ncbi:trimethylamine-N-oxide reductase (cytochrome c) [Desulfobaculum xiamenense]|uniref:trimethylamine-N-oxide reductase n=1 Tax=Desulfobaculum xiamenense TaxID=995050 RepID=A0A846QV85_9BACT|nr:trimethylamine-N-oxide reductase TorA [Desulfobaculum xiamenense]NJB69465.1 trimethylamine-N-oxide reductase (cytochrome c) [Desulfobaculum xiamenense]